MADFEKSFGDFLESDEYDKLEESEREQLGGVMFAMLRSAYKAGWVAAGGELPTTASENKETE